MIVLQCVLLKSQQTLEKMRGLILAAINNVIRCGHYSRVTTIKGMATIQGWLILKVWLLFKGDYY